MVYFNSHFSPAPSPTNLTNLTNPTSSHNTHVTLTHLHLWFLHNSGRRDCRMLRAFVSKSSFVTFATARERESWEET